ncbi:DUF3830 family protein [Halalkalibacterium ligniniphilum]|uniref:DUF3830 family protein n=1 Tax=Halalkalibacterium ligniniphilum TaxID=1134413 RepID=UPI0003485618|nr:DUF3830 family protein [Halalkalibacterium ligniniphilum]
MRRILISFKNGEVFPATLNEEKAPQTCKNVWETLPFYSIVKHSRWSGREVNFELQTKILPAKENQTIFTSAGEVVYWRDWTNEYEEAPFEVLAIYYGAEHTRSWKGNEPVNVFAQIDASHLERLKEVGERIWLKGTEQVYIQKLEG